MKIEKAKMICAVCGEPAACLGAYEGSKEYEYACNACCGHGNEDGHCESVGTDDPELI